MDKMSVAKAGFDMLMILSACDNEITDTEHTRIIDFFNRSANIDFAIPEEGCYLSSLDRPATIARFKEVTSFMQTTGTSVERNMLLKFVLGVVFADKRISEDEYFFLKILGEIWKIDIDKHLKT